ncbi:uncharacterized protein [Triticum aestivum]|uniref:uncharacterized protein n=1 Tax=Triticum aestivum TaxID=4565 RepID=UPI001D02BA32|nr:uncharacterized protein LOC123055809 [Triticum aestivum]
MPWPPLSRMPLVASGDRVPSQRTREYQARHHHHQASMGVFPASKRCPWATSSAQSSARPRPGRPLSASPAQHRTLHHCQQSLLVGDEGIWMTISRDAGFFPNLRMRYLVKQMLPSPYRERLSSLENLVLIMGDRRGLLRPDGGRALQLLGGRLHREAPRPRHTDYRPALGKKCPTSI